MERLFATAGISPTNSWAAHSVNCVNAGLDIDDTVSPSGLRDHDWVEGFFQIGLQEAIDDGLSEWEGCGLLRQARYG